MLIDFFDENNEVMTRNQNCDFVARVLGNYNKNKCFIKVKTT